MFLHYLKITVRNLWKARSYSSINILGLAIGLASSLIILLHVLDELSYDHFHKKSKRIFRVATHVKLENGAQEGMATIPGRWAWQMVAEFPEVENAVRFYKYRTDIIVQSLHDMSSFYEGNFYWADSTVLEIFTFPLLQGDLLSALNKPNSVVITQQAARKYFGEANPVGKKLRYINRETSFDLNVTGVIADVPRQSHFHPDFLASLSTFKPGTWHWHYDLPTSWTNYFYQSYIVLNKESSATAVQSRLPVFLKNHIGPESNNFEPFLQPLTSIHLNSKLRAEFEPNGERRSVLIFFSISLLILLVACINYINLATARSGRRSREVGLRKTLGSKRIELFAQFYGESFLISLLALVVGLGLAELILPFFNDLTGRSLSLGTLFLFPGSLLYFSLFVGFMALLAGFYPALVISGYSPTSAMKRALVGSEKKWTLRQVLVISQFAITVFLLCATQIIDRQVEYLNAETPRIDDTQVITLPLRAKDASQKLPALKNKLLSHSQILVAAACSHVPLTGKKQGQFSIQQHQENQLRFDSDYFSADQDFARLFKLQLVSGRDFFAAPGGISRERGYLLNERAVKVLGLSVESALGLSIKDEFFEYEGKVVGVVKDFHYEALHKPIGSLLIKLDPPFVRFLSIRLKSNDLPQTMALIEQEWRTIFPAVPFEYTFLEDDIGSLYRAEASFGVVFKLFSAIGILVSCLGLFGLTAYAAEQRTREVGIRKVLGARVAGLIGLLSKEFFALVAIAHLIAWPAAYFIMDLWLRNFYYRISIGWETLVLSSVIVAVVAFVTVSSQTLRAALANPVETLRHD